MCSAISKREMAKKRQPRLLKKVEKDNLLHLHNAFAHVDVKPKELTKEEEIFKAVTETCEEHYLLTDSECGLSLIEDKDCVKAIEGMENGYVLKFRMECERAFALRQFAIRLSKKLNCLRRFFVKENSVRYAGVPKPMYFLECAMVLEDNRGKEPIDRSGEEDDDEFLFQWKKRSMVGKQSEDEDKSEDKSEDKNEDKVEVETQEAAEPVYDGTQTEEKVNEMLEDAEVVLTEESYADADEAYANFA